MTADPNDPQATADESAGAAPDGEAAAPVEAAQDSEAAEVAAALDRAQSLRILEAILFAAPEPLDRATILRHLPKGADADTLIDELEKQYSGRGVNLVRAGGKFAMRTAPDLAHVLRIEREMPRNGGTRRRSFSDAAFCRMDSDRS